MSAYGRSFINKRSLFMKCLLLGKCLPVRCLLMGDFCLWEVSPYGRCLVTGGVCLWEVSRYNGGVSL
jgi:hypothetical protein